MYLNREKLPFDNNKNLKRISHGRFSRGIDNFQKN